ncbi:MAG TPA: DUF4097 family beta strand repeat-containing protein [bacterium]|nr:DUF4097 family beta strand repeat-containing protein [bacterium]
MRGPLCRMLPVVLLALACLYTYRLVIPEAHTYAATDISALGAATLNGTISVTASSDTAITVDVARHAYGRDSSDAAKALANVVYGDTVIGRELKIKADMPSSDRPYGADFDIAAPETLDLSLSTTNGSITVTSLAGDIRASTTNGNVQLTGTTGSANLSTTNGKLVVQVHSGTVHGTTSNGTIDCDVSSLGAADSVDLETTNGKVTLLLPVDVSALIDATNTNGSITFYDYTVTYNTQTSNHVRGTIGSGASPIMITTTNGDIVVRRRS